MALTTEDMDFKKGRLKIRDQLQVQPYLPLPLLEDQNHGS